MVKILEESEIDLGEVGKFKPSILEEFMKLNPSPVEAKFVNLIDEYDKKINEQMSYNIGLFCKMNRIYWRIKEIDELRVRRQKLADDFKKYLEMFPPTDKKNGNTTLYYRNKYHM